MAGESIESRKSALPLVLGSILVVVILLVGFGAWALREIYAQKTESQRESQMVAMIAHTWMTSDPQFIKEFGPLSTASGVTVFSPDQQVPPTAHVRYHVVGGKSAGDAEIWLKQDPNTSWSVSGAILTTADQRTIRVGSPPSPVPVAGTSN